MSASKGPARLSGQVRGRIAGGLKLVLPHRLPTLVLAGCGARGGPATRQELRKRGAVAFVRHLLAVVLLASQGVVVPALAQPTPRVLSDAECPDCALGLRHVLALGDTSGPGMLTSSLNVVHRDSRGYYYVKNDVSPRFWVFDSTGAAIRQIGRQGDGPGEFRLISAFVVSSLDSIYVFDPVQRRLSVFSPTHQFQRSARLTFSAGFDAAAVGPLIVVNADIRTPDRVGFPLHAIDLNGHIRRSFGSETGVFRSDIPYLGRRTVAQGDSGEVWSGWLNQYVMESWDTTGHLQRLERREVDWYPPYWERQPVTGEFPPTPYIRRLAEYADTLWVMVLVADRNWHSAIQRIQLPNGEMSFAVTDENDYHDTIIEAFDLRTGRLVGSMREPRVLTGFAGHRLVYGPEIDRAGNPVVGIWEIVSRDD